MRICGVVGGDKRSVCTSSVDCCSDGMFCNGTSVECDEDRDIEEELKRNSVIEPTFVERHETVLGD